ncbi:hypothetical protein [Roseivirga seohaensis]|uniref:hypothetical protein n=1 Tax=Roseivirga seohaensis TaxID=1914963 RepID=UPI003BAD7FEE
MENQGFDPKEIEKFKAKIKATGNSYVVIDSEDNSDDYMNFNFVGSYDGREVVFDVALYTLKIQHASEIYELAEHEAAKKFPEYKAIAYEEDENGDIAPLGDLEEEIGLYMAEVMEELEEEDAVKVQEHVDIDENIDFGVGLDVGLNVEKITHEVIEKFIKDFTNDTLELDPTYFSFQMDNEDDEDDEE